MQILDKMLPFYLHLTPSWCYVTVYLIKNWYANLSSQMTNELQKN